MWKSRIQNSVCGQLKPRVGACGFVSLCLCYLVECYKHIPFWNICTVIVKENGVHNIAGPWKIVITRRNLALPNISCEFWDKRPWTKVEDCKKIMPIHVSALSPTLLRYDMTAFFVLAVSCMLVKDLRSTKVPDFLWESTSKPVMCFKPVMMRLNIFI